MNMLKTKYIGKPEKDSTNKVAKDGAWAYIFFNSTANMHH